ncbi:methylated-DNA--[protein]-cysteine S-methyltransferase [Colwellia echini]|uniref:Methylated-DNA--protein-cysteine methyltransferase n=1 Tax=Colwellia echini TaxID=1982103 RepID=A0ABY3MZI9_9GAMM|nr:methylated-DNA--[protein]-cysteine S-methyltransferase [Colwellia echini]TYK66610.1 methylated-DNA--[protein]-cysteine S-methyltransferase [Colwellia echini]
MFVEYIDTPLGLFEIMATDKGICQAIFCGDKVCVSDANGQQHQGNAITAECKQQLIEYFSGHRQNFTVPLDAKGTPFQQSVWDCLVNIPFGDVKSYGEIAKQINNPKGSQAVGGANSRNPISLIVPCHRVIGGNGSLTGYAGGIERKLWLLNHEGFAVNSSTADIAKGVKNIIKTRQAKTQFLR